jgi:hypothetical protein
MMRKTSPQKITAGKNDMLPEHDFTGGVRGKYYKDRLQGYTINIYKTDGTTLVKDINRKRQSLPRYRGENQHANRSRRLC